MPYKTEHAARIRQPSSFRKDTLRSVDITPSIRIIVGKLKPSGKSMVTQAFRFKKRYWTPYRAKAWLAEHGIKWILFEQAIGS